MGQPSQNSDVFNAVQNKAGGEGDGDEVQKGLQEAKPAPAVEDIQSRCVCAQSTMQL